MLPNYFLPEVDELPFSWMNRLALANGFKDTNDMLQSLGFIKGKAVKRQHDYLLKITKLMPKNDWTITLMKMYLAEGLQQERLIPELNEEEHLYLCPCCMQEDIKTHGAVVYHYQHQYPGAFTCWKHGVNLLHVAPDARLKPIPDESDLTPVVGGYDSDREMRQFRRCYSKSSLYYRVTKYQLETLLSDNHLTVDNILDIREQYPLDLELTNEICDDRCCKHPGGRNCYMTTDFYVIYKDGSEKAFSIKTSKKLLNKKRTKEKLDIERCYWEKFRHVPYEIVFKEDMNVVFAENIRIVSKFYNASSVFDDMSMLKHMIATKRIQVDMESEPLDFPYLLEQYREALPEVKGGAPVCQTHST